MGQATGPVRKRISGFVGPSSTFYVDLYPVTTQLPGQTQLQSDVTGGDPRKLTETG